MPVSELPFHFVHEHAGNKVSDTQQTGRHELEAPGQREGTLSLCVWERNQLVRFYTVYLQG